MEYRNIIFNAARDGNLKRLQLFLDARNASEVRKLLSSACSGTPPLVIAARNGHTNVIKYLLDKGADIELPGSVLFDGETIEKAPPLWCAAAAGHYTAVELLVSRGAEVNHTTATNSTPLRAACFDGHLSIVKYLVEHGADMEKANRHGHTSLMIACYRGHVGIVEYLLSQGVDFNYRSPKGNTALHDAAESGSVEILKLLLRWGASMQQDAYGMTPILSAASVGHASVVDYLVDETICSSGEKLRSLLLLGATYVDKKRDIAGAVRCWVKAMTLKKCSAVTSDDNVSFLLNNPQAGVVYRVSAEIDTMDHLGRIRDDPEALRMQALLIRERVLGPMHPDVAYFVRYRGAIYADVGDFQRCIELWLYALEMQRSHWEALCAMTMSNFVSFAELFAFMLNTENTEERWRRVRFDDVFCVLQHAVSELRRTLTSTNEATIGCKAVHNAIGSVHVCEEGMSDQGHMARRQRMLIVTLHLACLACKLEFGMTAEQMFMLKKLAYDLVQLDARGINDTTLLHLACCADTTALSQHPVCRFPTLDVVQLLLDVGADPLATDADGNTPLHVLVNNKASRQSIMRALLAGGAHIDMKNRRGVSVLDTLKVKSPTVTDATPCWLQHTTLKCMAATTIMEHKLPYRGVVPQHLYAFVAIH